VLTDLLFRHFFDGLALAGALAEWALACWLLDAAPSPVWHAVVPASLAVLNRLAARRLMREPATGFLAGRTGHVVLATAFGALVAASVVVALAGAWGVAWLLGALTAEAGVHGVAGPEPVFGAGFRWLAGLAVAFTGASVAHGYTRGYRSLTVTALTVPVSGLAEAAARLRVVHLSDLHLGPLADRAALRDALARANALEPDLVCVTGDIVDTPAADLESWIPELAVLRARHGVFAILGNHDARSGADRVAAALCRFTDWRLLRDEVATVPLGDGRLHIVGLEDRLRRDAAERLPELLARIPAEDPAILLAHRPDVVDAAAAAGLPLVLAGHTHGGQLAVPGVPRLNVARLLGMRLDAGTFTRDGTVLHVNRGLGTSGQRVRVGAAREIAVVTLVPGRAPLTSSASRR
jgi:predicted MPP superfamily phosphohydrolase